MVQQPKKLLELVHDQIQLRHYSHRTEESYIQPLAALLFLYRYVLNMEVDLVIILSEQNEANIFRLFLRRRLVLSMALCAGRTNGPSLDFLYSFVGDFPTHLAWRNSNKGRLHFRRPRAKKEITN